MIARASIDGSHLSYRHGQSWGESNGPSTLKILLLTYGVPWPPDSGARIRDFNLLRGLASHAEVVLCCFAKDESEIPDLSVLRSLCREVRIYRPGRRSAWQHAGAIAKALRAGRPLATHPFYYAEFASELLAVARREAVEIFQIEHSFLAGYRGAVPENCRSVLSFHNVGWVQYARMARLDTGLRRRAGFLLKALLMRRWEARYAGRFSRCITVSSADAAVLCRANPSLPVSVVDNGVDCLTFRMLPEAPSGNDVLFAGVLGYPPNADAVRFFCERILPLVRREVPDARLLIAGQNPPAEVRALAASGAALVLPDVADIIPCYQRARLAVVPLRAGGGTRLKILEAMALGRAVVSTSIGCEGLSVAHGRDILIADHPREFAACVVSLLRDAASRAELAGRARRTVESQYDWRISTARLLDVYASLLGREGAGRTGSPGAA